MNYNSIDEILAAGITNMEVLRNNYKQDDGKDTITGVDWFTFNSTVASTIYAGGNSFISFNSSQEDLKVNRRDGAMYSLYREEGTLYNYYKFLKIRWVGYSQYNKTTSEYALTYDVILWDTGDISLHMVTIPTSANTGTYSITADKTYSYTVSTSSPDVTFVKTGSGFTVSTSIIWLEPPFAKRYLIRSGSTYYTVVDGALLALGVDNLTSEVFLTSGTEEIPSISLLLGLTNPELLYWVEEERGIPNNGLVVYGTPSLPQIVLYEEKTIPENSIISKAEVYNAELATYTITFDGGESWMYYDTNTNAWAIAESDNDGMDAATVKNLTAEQWAMAPLASTYQFRCILTSIESRSGKIYLKTIATE